MKKFSIHAFTLVEIVVVIAIILIIILGFNFISFNNISNKQRIETNAIQITNNFEEIRNNALLGKGIGVDLYIPKKYRMDFSTSGSGIIKTQYLSGTYLNYNYFNKKIDFSDPFESLSQVNCLKLDKTGDGNSFNSGTIGTGTIFIEGSNLTLSGGCSNNEKILELEIKRKQNTKKIQINTLNGLIKVIK